MVIRAFFNVLPCIPLAIYFPVAASVLFLRTDLTPVVLLFIIPIGYLTGWCAQWSLQHNATSEELAEMNRREQDSYNWPTW